MTTIAQQAICTCTYCLFGPYDEACKIAKANLKKLKRTRKRKVH